jgi:hypothetical protein
VFGILFYVLFALAVGAALVTWRLAVSAAAV